MKKLITLMTLFALVLCSCNYEDKPVPSAETTLASETTVRITLPDPLPLPNEILLLDDPYFDASESDEIMFYRRVYYGVPGEIDDIGRATSGYPAGFEEEWVPKRNEMRILTSVKYFNIKKEDFVTSIEKMHQWEVERDGNDCDVFLEGYELPNPDIIYTFDNEVINAYYRRENPVEPDWTKVKTYESYAEYLAANPQ